MTFISLRVIETTCSPRMLCNISPFSRPAIPAWWSLFVIFFILATYFCSNVPRIFFVPIFTLEFRFRIGFDVASHKIPSGTKG